MPLDHIDILKEGGIGVIPTDTLYGLVGQALSQVAVDRIYALKQRPPQKPCIILVSSIEDLEQFGVDLDMETHEILKELWPGPTSIILPIKADHLSYLDRGTHTLAFRLPDNIDLVKLLSLTGPLIAPSANPDSQPPAETIDQAQAYFGPHVDFYVDGGRRNGSPSRLIKLENGQMTVLRP